MREVVAALVLGAIGCVAAPDEARERRRPSAVRAPEQSYDEAVAQQAAAADPEREVRPDSPYAEQQILDAVDLSGLPAWSGEELAHAFALVRDTRFMNGVPPQGLTRRVSFLYPDDGCWARAQAMTFLAVDVGLVRPATVYDFGELSVATRHHPEGRASWWYHLAPIVAVGRTAYVLDPSIEPERPLELAEWVARQGDPEAIGVTVCDAAAFDPLGPCGAPPPDVPAQGVVSDEFDFLLAEWSRQVELGRDPWTVLADSPPWEE